MEQRHIWRVKKEYFRQLKDGSKNLEIRVGYAQVKKVKEGDIITFENYGHNEFRVQRIATYHSLEQMLSTEGVDQVLPGMTPDQALSTLHGIYPPDREKLGVYVFELQYLSPRPTRVFLTASTLLKQGKNQTFSKMIADSYIITDWITKDYPEHVDSFYSKFVPGVFFGDREIIACYVNSKIVGVIVLKKALAGERKVCTLYVKPEFQGQGIATRLLERGFEWLGTTKPLVTIADYKLEQFTSIIQKYGWERTQVLPKYYNDHSDEYVYNGTIC